MTDSVDIKIKLSSDNWSYRYPSARVYINDTVIYDNKIEQPEDVVWSGELEDGTHKLTIEMYGKQGSDTRTDSNGNIVEDVMLNIDSVEFEDIDIGYLKWSHSEYYPDCSGTHNAPEKLAECVNLGYNGKWELTFSAPIYLWLLENI